MSSTATCLVSVVGLIAHGTTYQNSAAGVGKSCLCSRFKYSGVDEYVSDHPSLLALHEFESQVISTEPFIYWGPRTITHTRAGKDITVKYEVVEHTVFYHDETSEPFPLLRKLTNPQQYAKKVSQPPESSQKISYYARDAIGFADKYICLPYPANSSKLARGFLLAVDVSSKGSQFEFQLAAVETIVSELRKNNPLVIAATKRDIACQASLYRLMEWASKNKIIVVETSAKENVNVEDAFRLVAAKVLGRKVKINDSFFDYASGSGYLLSTRSQAKKELKSYLKEFVLSSSVTIDKFEKIEAYQNSLKILGKFVTDEIMGSHLLVVRNKEVGEYPGVEDNPDMRLEMLEDYIEGQVDFIAHKKILYL